MSHFTINSSLGSIYSENFSFPDGEERPSKIQKTTGEVTEKGFTENGKELADDEVEPQLDSLEELLSFQAEDVDALFAMDSNFDALLGNLLNREENFRGLIDSLEESTISNMEPSFDIAESFNELPSNKRPVSLDAIKDKYWKHSEFREQTRKIINESHIFSQLKEGYFSNQIKLKTILAPKKPLNEKDEFKTGIKIIEIVKDLIKSQIGRNKQISIKLIALHQHNNVFFEYEDDQKEILKLKFRMSNLTKMDAEYSELLKNCIWKREKKATEKTTKRTVTLIKKQGIIVVAAKILKENIINISNYQGLQDTIDLMMKCVDSQGTNRLPGIIIDRLQAILNKTVKNSV